MGNNRQNILSGSVVKRVVEEIQSETIINLINVQSLIDAHVTYSGRISGRQYVWERAGAIVEVDERDVPELLSKRRGKKPCCGQERTKLFQLAE